MTIFKNRQTQNIYIFELWKGIGRYGGGQAGVRVDITVEPHDTHINLQTMELNSLPVINLAIPIM